MKKTILVAASFIAASSVYALTSVTAEAQPSAENYEMSNKQMGEPLDRVCLADPLVSETYDSKDNMVIVATTEGGQAFLHLSGECTVMTLMFASTVSGGEDGCVGVGDDITFSGNAGSGKICKIVAIHNWFEKPEEDPFYEY